MKMNNVIKCDICDKKIVLAGIVFQDKYFCCLECYNKFKKNNKELFKKPIHL